MWAQALPTHLSGGGLAPEELVVEGAVGRAEPGLQEDTAVGDGLQGGRALIGKAKPYEELQNQGLLKPPSLAYGWLGGWMASPTRWT